MVVYVKGCVIIIIMYVYCLAFLHVLLLTVFDNFDWLVVGGKRDVK